MSDSVNVRPAVSPLAGRPAPKELLIDVARLEREYFERRPDMADPTQRVSFGTSGHRGSPFRGAFMEAHILEITQAMMSASTTHEEDFVLPVRRRSCQR